MAAGIPVPSNKQGTRDPLKLIKEPVRVGYYDILNTVGKGNFAVVKLANNIITNSKVAIKMINKERAGEGSMEKIKREISNMRVLTHPNIIQLYQVMETDKMIYLVLEYASGGEIYDKLKSQGRMSEREARVKFKQIVAAVACCHSQCIVHRDLKIENLLLDADSNIKLADFGFSKQFASGSLLSTHCGSLPYAAPELFEGGDYDGPKVDIWSMGVILYTMVVGSLPFDAVNPVSLQKIILTGKIRVPYFMSTECEGLIRSMLKITPAKRASMPEVVGHEWMNEDGPDREFEHLMEVSLGRSGVEEELDAEVLKHLQSLQLDVQQTVKSVKERKLNYLYAVYHLLCKQRRSSRELRPTPLSTLAKTHRRSSITTGVVSDVQVLQESPADVRTHCQEKEEMEGSRAVVREGVDMVVGEVGGGGLGGGGEESRMEEDAISTCGPGLVGMSGDARRVSEDGMVGVESSDGGEDPPMEMVARYCTMRRHTIGMADHKEASNEQNDFGLGISGWHKLFEQVAAASTTAASETSVSGGALPALSLQCFLPLKPPTHSEQQAPHLSDLFNNPQQLLRLLSSNDPSDNNFLKPPQLLPPGGCGRRASDGGANIMPVQRHTDCMVLPPLHHPHTGRLKKEREGRSSERGLEREAIKRYMRSRGYLKRYTLAMTTPTHELSEDIQRRLANNPIKSCRSHLTRERTPHRDSLKDTCKLHLPSDRFRRSSDGVTINKKYQLGRSSSPDASVLQSTDSLQTSLRHLRLEHQQLQERFSKHEHLVDNNLSLQNSPGISPTPSPPNPSSHASSPVPQQPETCLYKHLQMLQLQQQNSICNVPCACSSCGPSTSHQLTLTAPEQNTTATISNFFNSPSFTSCQQAPQSFFFQPPQTCLFDTSLLTSSNLDSIKEDDDQSNPNSPFPHPLSHPPVHHAPLQDPPTYIDPIFFLQQTAQDYLLKQQQLHLQNQQQQQQLLEALRRQQQFILQQELMNLHSSHPSSHPSSYPDLSIHSSTNSTSHSDTSTQRLPRISITDHTGHSIDSSFSSHSDVDMLQDNHPLHPPSTHPPSTTHHHYDSFELSYDQALRSALPLNRFLDNNVLLSNKLLDANVVTKSSE